MSAQGPNLSHWPGNRTPVRWKADLSTGICLNFAAADPGEQERFLGGATAVLNDHYDTDGFGSLLAVLRPEVALERREVLLAAAATGDFQAFQPRLGETGFAVDRIVANLGGAGSPVEGQMAERGREPGGRDFARYRWLVDHAEEVLDEPQRFSALYAGELALVQRQLAGGGIEVELRDDLGLALLRSPGPVHRMVLNTLAGRCFRVLHSQRTEAGGLYRFHDRTESWFEVRTFSPAPRRDLEPVRAALEQREGTAGAGRWCLDPPDEPVPELYFGVPSTQAYGQLTRELLPSRIPPGFVEDLLVGFFASAGQESGG